MQIASGNVSLVYHCYRVLSYGCGVLTSDQQSALLLLADPIFVLALVFGVYYEISYFFPFHTFSRPQCIQPVVGVLQERRRYRAGLGMGVEYSPDRMIWQHTFFFGRTVYYSVTV